MRPRKKSLSQSVRPSTATSSRAAPSGGSVRRKSKKSSGELGKLTIATPQNSKLQALQRAGIIVPDEIPSDDDLVPLDFTLASSQEIGSIQSRFAVRHSHAIYHVALAATGLVRLRRDLRMAQAKFRLLNPGKPKNIVDAMMEEDTRISRMLDKIAIAEAEVGVLGAVAGGYEDIRNAASREISRRIGEKASID
jgi:hypothetical protein